MIEYIEFDQFGVVRIRCMDCGNVVAHRTERESEKFPGRLVYAMKRLSNWRQKQMDMNDGSFVEPIFCADCVNKPVDENAIMNQIQAGWEAEHKHQGKPDKELKVKKERWEKLRILKPNEPRPKKGKKVK